MNQNKMEKRKRKKLIRKAKGIRQIWLGSITCPKCHRRGRLRLREFKQFYLTKIGLKEYPKSYYHLQVYHSVWIPKSSFSPRSTRKPVRYRTYLGACNMGMKSEEEANKLIKMKNDRNNTNRTQ